MQEEQYNTRDRSYSAWHRRHSTMRFVGIESAQTLAMIDMDASLYVEYDDGTKEPLALIETAVDVGQDYKCATVTMKLAQRANLPAAVVLYKLSDRPNPADSRFQDIESFRVKRIHPPGAKKKWHSYSPNAWAQALERLRKAAAASVDALNGIDANS
jgi:hypothetical protein